MTKEEIYKNHIIERVQTYDTDIELETPEEKITYLFNEFMKAYSKYNHKTRATALTDWCQGLPSCIDILFPDYEIIEWGELHNLVKNDDFASSYWIDLGVYIDRLFKEFKVEKPEDIRMILFNGRISENVFYLPAGQLDRKVYEDLKHKLELIGGKWDKKVKGFVFKKDPSSLINELISGKNINLKKQYQFFATPEKIVEKLIEIADIQMLDKILEPSAGQGAIIKEINKYGITPDICELMDINLTVLKESGLKFNLVGSDFLLYESNKKYDKIIANPPFSKNQDIEHVMHMHNMLKKGGRLVTITSRHWEFASEKKCAQFRDFLESVNAEIIPIDANEFKESGTSIATNIVVING